MPSSAFPLVEATSSGGSPGEQMVARPCVSVMPNAVMTVSKPSRSRIATTVSTGIAAAPVTAERRLDVSYRSRPAKLIIDWKTAGGPGSTVTRSDSMRSRTASGSNTGWGRIVAPFTMHGVIEPQNPNAWKNGLITSIRSPDRMPSRSAYWLKPPMIGAERIMTPLGRPVVPEVNITRPRSSPVAAAARRAASAKPSGVAVARKSPNETVPAGVSPRRITVRSSESTV